MRRRVAAAIGSVHHERLLSTDEFLRTIPLTIDAMDDLVSEPSAVFLHHALQLAADEGLRVVITGEANDELCCGHGGMTHIRDGYYRRWLPYSRNRHGCDRRWQAWPRRSHRAAATSCERAARGDEYFWSYETAWMDTDKAAVLAPDVLRATRRARTHPCARRGAGSMRARTAVATISPTSSTR